MLQKIKQFAKKRKSPLIRVGLALAVAIGIVSAVSAFAAPTRHLTVQVNPTGLTPGSVEVEIQPANCQGGSRKTVPGGGTVTFGPCGNTSHSAIAHPGSFRKGNQTCTATQQSAPVNNSANLYYGCVADAVPAPAGGGGSTNPGQGRKPPAKPTPVKQFQDDIPWENPPADLLSQTVAKDNLSESYRTLFSLFSPTTLSKKTPREAAGGYWPICRNGQDIQVRRYVPQEGRRGVTAYAYSYKGAGYKVWKGLPYEKYGKYCKVWVNDYLMKKDFNWNIHKYCAILTHEAGHLAGRNDSSNKSSVMYLYGNNIPVPSNCRFLRN